MIDVGLLRACDRAVKKARLNRSEWVRLALREYLGRLQILELERRDQRAYETMPQSKKAKELAWEAEAAWPEGESKQAQVVVKSE